MDSPASMSQSAMPAERHRRNERPGAIPARQLLGELAPGGRHRKPEPTPAVRALQEAGA